MDIDAGILEENHGFRFHGLIAHLRAFTVETDGNIRPALDLVDQRGHLVERGMGQVDPENMYTLSGTFCDHAFKQGRGSKGYENFMCHEAN